MYVLCVFVVVGWVMVGIWIPLTKHEVFYSVYAVSYPNLLLPVTRDNERALRINRGCDKLFNSSCGVSTKDEVSASRYHYGKSKFNKTNTIQVKNIP